MGEPGMKEKGEGGGRGLSVARDPGRGSGASMYIAMLMTGWGSQV